MYIPLFFTISNIELDGSKEIESGGVEMIYGLLPEYPPSDIFISIICMSLYDIFIYIHISFV